MKKTKRIFITILLVVVFLLIGQTQAKASSSNLNLKNLDFDVNVNDDGSMDVVETWNIRISDTNTLFKTFKTDSKKYSSISDVKVKEITNGESKEFEEIDELMYHVTKDCYYGMMNDDDDFEIAWGVGLDDTTATKQYQISYTVNDVIAKYNDCAELYWQFVGSDFEINADKITGTITLPSEVEKKEDIRVWGHTEGLNGEIYATGLNKVEFEINHFVSGRFVEVRVAVPTDTIIYSDRTYDTEKLNSIIAEETKWAEDANKRRERQQKIDNTIGIVATLVALAISVWLVIRIVKKVKKMRNIKKKMPTQKFEYYRDIPRQDATPSEAITLLSNKISDFQSKELGRAFSATLLELNLKKCLDFEVTKDEKNKEIVKIKLLNEKQIDELKVDEKTIYSFIKNAIGSKEYITVKELEKYIKSHEHTVVSLKNNIDKIKKASLEKLDYIDNKNVSAREWYAAGTVGYGFLAIFIGAFLSVLVILFSEIAEVIVFATCALSIINIIINTIIILRLDQLTQKGIDEAEMWKGLKHYMEDFSMLDKREVPEITLWEKYLVYATAFGIADKVLKQLKTVYPNLESMTSDNTYTCMNLMINTNFTSSFSNSISSAMSSAYTSATASSGSGGGGGFSGGGGGGRRTVAVEVEDNPPLTYAFNIKEEEIWKVI